jgi:hypothetical protein
MKKLYFIFALALLSLSNVLIAQPYTATLEHGTNTQIFYGSNAFTAANAAAVDGDIIVLSAGNLGSATITKKIKVIGTGHYPHPVNVIPTVVGITFGAGSDSCLIEGLNIGNITANIPVRAIHISRCKIGEIQFNNGSRSCIIEGNVIGAIKCYDKDTANIITNNIFSTSGQGTGLNALSGFTNGTIIENNTFYLWMSGISIYYCVLRNNIIHAEYSYAGTLGSLIQYNYLPSATFFDTLSNVVQHTYSGPITGIISGGLGLFSYTADYHITNPTLYIGTDGTQIGIYGGQYPYKPKAIPYNPQIESKYIAPTTDINGNIQINFKVKAQNN